MVFAISFRESLGSVAAASPPYSLECAHLGSCVQHGGGAFFVYTLYYSFIDSVKHHNQKQSGEERVYLAFSSGFITEGLRAGT